MPSIGPKLAIVASAISQDPRELPRLARSMGFSGVQWDLGFARLDLTTLSASGRRELLRLFSTQSQQIVGLRGDIGAKGLLPGADVDRVIAQFDKLMEAAAGLGAPLLCVDIGSIPEPPAAPRPRPPITAEQAGMILLPAELSKTTPEPVEPPPPSAAELAARDQLRTALEEIGRRADRYSVVIAWRSELNSLSALNWALSEAHCPWFGVDLDPVAILRDDWDLDATLSALGGQVRHVRARDAARGADRRTRPALVGVGSTDWPQLLAGLNAADYRGWITVDPQDLPDRTMAADAALKFLRQLGA